MEIEEIEKNKIVKEAFLEMILEFLYNALTPDGDKIEFDHYNLSDDVMTLLLKKYDEKKFKEYERTLLKD